MPTDLRPFFRLLKVGAPINAYFLYAALELGRAGADRGLVFAASILFAVSAWRCVFPNRYGGHVVVHDGVASSTLVTRSLATFSEIAYVYFFAHALSIMNAGRADWIDTIGVAMVAAATLSQGFVWGAIGTGRRRLFVYEEIGWFLLFAGHTAGCAWLLVAGPTEPGVRTLLWLGVVFGAGYLPWQLFHLRSLLREATLQETRDDPAADGATVLERLRAALRERRPSTASDDWGGVIGVTWMACYWIAVIPVWMYVVLQTLGRP